LLEKEDVQFTELILAVAKYTNSCFAEIEKMNVFYFYQVLEVIQKQHERKS